MESSSGHFKVLIEERPNEVALPKVMMETIFCHLTLPELQRARETCREWDKIILENRSVRNVHLLWERAKPTFGYRVCRLPYVYVNSRKCEILRVGIFRVVLFWPYSLISLFLVFLGVITLFLTLNWGLQMSTLLSDLYFLNYWAMPHESTLGFTRSTRVSRTTTRTTAANMVWNLLGFSLIASTCHVIMAILQLVTVIGWPNAVNHFAAAWMIFWPFGMDYHESSLPPLPPADPRLGSLREFLQVTLHKPNEDSRMIFYLPSSRIESWDLREDH
eukprot:Phypoly_transcript_11995.p1 GENE.Phypoly_transcript_11995~~Phypoly_transcript_11995.p1  ORF type:complete len:275 (+),score=6.13 Phypoly_transcript_11995:111-935(+)